MIRLSEGSSLMLSTSDSAERFDRVFAPEARGILAGGEAMSGTTGKVALVVFALRQERKTRHRIYCMSRPASLQDAQAYNIVPVVSATAFTTG
jgi:hypothetical protein